MKIAVANLKAEFNEIEIKFWSEAFNTQYPQKADANKKVIVAPPAVFLEFIKSSQEKANLDYAVAAQSISQFEKGTYTGEVTAPMIASFANFVIIGHSEERKITKETYSVIQQKIDLANQYHLQVILCAEKPESYSGQIFALAYEPAAAIGIGAAADPQASWQKMAAIAKLTKAEHHLYGGSVNSQNVASFVSAGFNGVLVGKKSLDPSEFLAIVANL